MKEWLISPKIESGFINKHPEVNSIFLQLLFNRGLKDKVTIDSFLNSKLDDNLIVSFGFGLDFYDPFIFNDMTAATELIIKHIKQGSKIVVYGDYDADGVTSSVILLETLKIFQVQVEVYLPDRVNEGYGLNKKAINQIVNDDFKLVITVDNGIRNKAEVEYAKSKGLDIIITDHHVLPEEESEIPDCLIINPADKRNDYPCPFLAGVGVAFKLISALLLKSKLNDSQKRLILEKSLDLVAIGTIADMVSLLGENRLLVKRGLEILNRTKRLGVKELVKVAKINESRELEAWNVGWQLGPRLNAASRLGHANTAFGLLATKEAVEARKLAEELNKQNLERQQITKQITDEVEKQIDPDNLPNIIIGLASKNETWNEGVIGLVAGRIAEKYYRPTLVITRIIDDEEKDISKKTSFKGSGRSIPELNLIKIIEACSNELDKYGGHPMACGFSVESEDKVEAFRDKIGALVDVELKDSNLIPKLEIEAKLEVSDLDISLADEIKKLAPFGQHNQQPKLASFGLVVEEVVFMGSDSQHIKLRLSGIWALAFGAAKRYKDFKIGDKVDVAYYLEVNEFNGRRDAQLKIVDLKLA